MLMVMSAGPGGHNSPTLPPTRDQPPHLAWRDLIPCQVCPQPAVVSAAAVGDDVVMSK